MDIEQLAIQNFLTIGQAELELDSRGLLLIQGQNDDDSSASSNGAGKSSLVDALCWCLYGTTARDVSGDEVINDQAKKDTAVSITLADGATRYRIARFRKHYQHKNQLLVWEQVAGHPDIDLSKASDKDTQAVVNRIMGCSLAVFVGAIVAAQEKTPDLPGMTDKHLKLLIEEAAGVDVLSAAYTEARQRATRLEAEQISCEREVAALTRRQSQLQEELQQASTAHDTFDAARKDRARAELSRLKPLEQRRETALAQLALSDEAGLLAQQATLDAELASHKAQQAQLQVHLQAERKANDHVTRCRVTLEHGKTTLAQAEQAVTALASTVGQPCGECGKIYCEQDLDTARHLRMLDCQQAKQALLTAATACKIAIQQHASLLAVLNDFKTGMTDVSSTSRQLTDVRQSLTRLLETKHLLATLDKEMDAVKADARAKLQEANPWAKVVEAKQTDFSRIAVELKTLQTTADNLAAQHALASDAVKVFGPAGVRAHILDTVTPLLNARTSEYLGALADGHLHAVWSTLARTAKGEVKEKFNIEVTHDKGGKSFKALSGGEKRKVRLATAMALQDLVATRASKPINLFVGDEIDHALDEPGLERLMTVLERKAKERGTVLIVSHNSLADWCDQVIHVTKSGGCSTVTGATHRGF